MHCYISHVRDLSLIDISVFRLLGGLSIDRLIFRDSVCGRASSSGTAGCCAVMYCIVLLMEIGMEGKCGATTSLGTDLLNI
jgi:hypothetical protein